MAKKVVERTPCNAADLAAVSGAVVIYTQDGAVVMTPALARDVAAKLPDLAALAEHPMMHKLED